MAMQGVNMPLAFVGQEWVWAEVFKGYGLSLEDQYDFYSGPAFLPWFRVTLQTTLRDRRRRCCCCGGVVCGARQDTVENIA